MGIALAIVIGILAAWAIAHFYYRKSSKKLKDQLSEVSSLISGLPGGHAAFREYEKTRKIRGVKGVPPPLPHAFYGSVTTNGSPAPIGTRVEARGEGVRIGIKGNPIVTTKVGKYGGAGVQGDVADGDMMLVGQGDIVDGDMMLVGQGDITDRATMLVVQGDIADGATLTFHVNDVPTGQSAEWHSGNVTQLNLTVLG